MLDVLVNGSQTTLDIVSQASRSGIELLCLWAFPVSSPDHTIRSVGIKLLARLIVPTLIERLSSDETWGILQGKKKVNRVAIYGF